MKKQLKTANRWQGKIKCEKVDKKTVNTKPNGTQSIREILFRNTQGMAYDNVKTPFYEDQASFSSKPMNVIQDMEMTEKMQYLEETSAEAMALRDKIIEYKSQQEAEAKKLEDARKQQQADYQKWLDTKKTE